MRKITRSCAITGRKCVVLHRTGQQDNSQYLLREKCGLETSDFLPHADIDFFRGIFFFNEFEMPFWWRGIGEKCKWPSAAATVMSSRKGFRPNLPRRIFRGFARYVRGILFFETSLAKLNVILSDGNNDLSEFV